MQLAGEDVEVGEVDPDEIFHVAGKDEMKETEMCIRDRLYSSPNAIHSRFFT